MKYLLLVLFSVLTFIPSFSQFENIMISDVFNPKEPSISQDINQPDLLIVASNLNSYHISIDTGITWTQTQLISDLGVYGDPVIVVDGESNFYYLHLANPYEFYPDGDTLDRIVCQRSLNNGNSWSNGSYFGLDPDKDNTKEWAVVDFENDHLYATWTQYDHYESLDPADSSQILFVKSEDAGVTWSTPIRLNEHAGNAADSDSTVKGAVPTVGPEGEIYVSWAGPNGIRFDRSMDGGNTWLAEDILVDSMAGGWRFEVPGLDKCNGLPVTVCDISGGPNEGTIYINWSDQRNGSTDTDIWLSKSEDGGDTWTEALRVNDDPPGKHQFLSWMDIDQSNGHIYIVYYDRRNHSGDSTDVFLARSTDGGESFTNILLSESPFLPVDSVEFGDYTNIVANEGIVRPVWTRFEDQIFSIWTALVDYSIWTSIDENQQIVKGLKCYPNPAKDIISLTFVLEEQSELSIQILDINGRIIAEPMMKKATSPGFHDYHFELGKYFLKSGMYYLKVATKNEYRTMKFLIE
jgi:hypothetical protein